MWKKALLVSIAAMAAAFPAAKASSPFAIPLRTRSRQPVPDTDTIVPEFLTLFNNTLKKYNAGTYLPTYPGLKDPHSKRATSEPLTSQCNPANNDLLYYGPVQIGNQTFTIDFDTGSSDLFVRGPACGVDQGCPGTNKYNGLGKDLGNTITGTYSSLKISGKNYLDTVTIENLTAKNTNVIAVSQAEDWGDRFPDGLMEMGFSSIARSNQPTFIEKLISANKLPTEEFCFYFGRCNENTGDSSKMTIGGRNPAKYSGNFTKVSVLKKDYWRIKIDGVKVGNESVNLPGEAITDTGTTGVVMSSQYALPLNKAMGGIPIPWGSTGGLNLTAYVIPRHSTTPISFVFGVTPLLFSPKDISVGFFTLGVAKLLKHKSLIKKLERQQRRQQEEPLCISAIFQADMGPTTNPPGESFNIIGDSLLKNWYSCYSYEGSASVQFAKAVG